MILQKNSDKEKTFAHILSALSYSIDGYKAVWKDEKAFRLVFFEAVIVFIIAVIVADSWICMIILVLPSFLSLIIELLNSAIENTIDRISLELHPLSKKAKDMGSAAQCLVQFFLCFVWLSFFLVHI